MPYIGRKYVLKLLIICWIRGRVNALTHKIHMTVRSNVPKYIMNLLNKAPSGELTISVHHHHHYKLKRELLS